MILLLSRFIKLLEILAEWIIKDEIEPQAQLNSGMHYWGRKGIFAPGQERRSFWAALSSRHIIFSSTLTWAHKGGVGGGAFSKERNRGEGKLAQVQDLLRSWSLHFLSLQFSCWQRKTQTLLQERRVGRRTKVIWKIWFLKNGSSFVSICFSLEQDIFHKSYLYLKYFMATWNIIFPLHPLRLSKQPHLKEE